MPSVVTDVSKAASILGAFPKNRLNKLKLTKRQQKVRATAAAIVGSAAKGKKKNISDDVRQWRKKNFERIKQKHRWPKD